MCASIARETYADIAPDYGGGVRAYVTAMRGCDKFCAFCVVPYVRGRERSIPPADLMREIGELAARGVREVMLLGQTVNAYRFGDTDFGALLRMIAAIDGIERIRFTSPHPSDMSDSIIDAMATEPKVQPYLHLPLQSGIDRILAAMERGYTVAEYLALVERVRAAIPGLAMSTDIIVGFHGEEESDFAATLAMMRDGRLRRRVHLQIFGPRAYARVQAGRHGQRGGEGAAADRSDRDPGRDLAGAQSRDDRARIPGAGRRPRAPRRRDARGQDAAVQDGNVPGASKESAPATPSTVRVESATGHSLIVLDRMKHSTQVQIIHQIFEAIDRGTPPMAARFTRNDTAAYTSSERAAREREVLFRNHPIVAGFSSQIPNPGDYLIEDLAPVPLLVVRNASGELRAFVNICRHRGAKLVSWMRHRVRNDFHAPTTPGATTLTGASSRFPTITDSKDSIALRAAWSRCRSPKSTA